MVISERIVNVGYVLILVIQLFPEVNTGNWPQKNMSVGMNEKKRLFTIELCKDLMFGHVDNWHMPTVVWFLINNNVGNIFSLSFYSYSVFILHPRYLIVFHWRLSDRKSPGISQYSIHSQQCCSLDGLRPLRYFQILQSLYQSIGGYTKRTNYTWYNCHFHIPWFFNSLANSRYLSLFFTFF